ncbi:hypothetical protein FB567DRAFT_564303 [Paraphoma chrysanthemicola]|uniref:Rhodopsin domain-containing protein n=1 Tax=Paraphoma chrysanthemicola TaxID=798071 RepID=A0A8K0QV29_9PLEO|nr:hypothetical protein FB567DRAFT_564303 [Paraphoma chrysanthemicola]
MVESRQDEALAIVGVFAVFAFIFVGVRVYSRYLGRNFGWDDYLIIAATIFFFGQTLTIWKFILLTGTGYHIYDLPKQTVHEKIVANKWSFSIQMLYHPLMGSIRASIIMFLFRMKDNRRRIRYSLHVVFWLNILYSVSTSLGNILQCNPVRYTWDKPAMDTVDAAGNIIAGGKCIQSRIFVLTSCALSIFMDLIIIPIPSIMVWNLQMELKTKILVVIVMSLGWVATGVSVGRFIVYYYRFAPTNLDRTWDIGIAISIAEPAVHIMSACAPATKCLFRYLFPYFARSRTPAYYEDRHTGQVTPRMSKFGSRGSRTLGSFQFGFRSGSDEREGDVDVVVQEDGRVVERGDAKGSVYALNRLSSSDSRDTVQRSSEDKGKESMEVSMAPRTSCTRTTATSLNEPAEVEPKHCLAQAK